MKRRRSIVLTLLILLIAVSGLLGGVYLFARRQPDFYREASREDVVDPISAAEIFTRYGDVRNDILNAPEWAASFEADKVNAFLREHFAKGASLEKSLDGKLTDPRVAIDGDKLILAATYQAAPYPNWESDRTTTVVSVELKLWVVPKQPCTVAVEVCAMKAGAIPIGSQRYLDRLGEAARDNNIDVTWYRKDGHPVGLFRFYANQPRPTRFIRAVTVADGRFAISGKNIPEGTAPAEAAVER